MKRELPATHWVCPLCGDENVDNRVYMASLAYTDKDLLQVIILKLTSKVGICKDCAELMNVLFPEFEVLDNPTQAEFHFLFQDTGSMKH